MRVELPEDVHRRAKALAALSGKTIAKWAEEALTAAVEAQEKDKRRG